MQIRSDYTSFQNNNYRESHTHHITECHFEEEIAKQQKGGAGPAQTSAVQSGDAELSKDGDIYQMNISGPVTKSSPGKSSGGLIKGFWDALGDEGSESSKNVMIVFKENIMDRMHEASDTIKSTFQSQVIDRALNIRTRIRSGLQNGFKRSGIKKDAFTALTDGQTYAGQGKHTKDKNKEGQVTTLKKEEDIPMKVLVHSHLMDSYNKRGEYSQLNDNLTYQKPKNIPVKQKTD